MSADQGQWFKLWCSADDDPDLGNLSLEDFARWCKLGMYIKKHGSNGEVKIKTPAYPLQSKFRVTTFVEVTEILQRFPNVEVEENVTVSAPLLIIRFRNWHKYQVDSSADRMRKKRERDGTRREEKRREENTPPLPPPGWNADASKTDNAAVKKPATPPETAAFALASDGNKRPRKRPAPDTARQYAQEWRSESWPSVRRFVALYNELSPKEWPSVRLLDDARSQKIKAYIHQFPEQSFWEAVYKHASESTFCRNYHGADLGWILQRGKDGNENCLKIFERKFDR